MIDNDPEASGYQSPTRLAEQYHITDRTIDTWAKKGLVRTIPNPTRRRAKLYNRADVERLAHGTTTPESPQPEAPSPTPSTELVPLSDLLGVLNRKDDQLAEANDKLQRAAVEIGRLQGEVGKLQERLDTQQKLLEAGEDRDKQLSAAEAELTQLRREVARLRRPWWLWWLRQK